MANDIRSIEGNARVCCFNRPCHHTVLKQTIATLPGPWHIFASGPRLPQQTFLDLRFHFIESKMSDIYQQIYDADISAGSGVQAILKGSPLPSSGYVIVSEAVDKTKVADVLSDVVIPDSKKRSYQLAEALFDNYDLLSSIPDEITGQEESEVDELLEYIVDRAPMALARQYIEKGSGRPYSDTAWYALVKETWFRPFSIGSSPTRSGWEHVFLGEWKAGANTVGGLHWWYFYLSKMDKITYGGAKYGNADSQSGLVIPEIATLTFSWNVGARSIYKKIGGFFVGLSVEGLMAMGMVRASNATTAPNIAVIQGAEVELKMFKSPDSRSVNTFYPIFRRALITVNPPPPPPKKITANKNGGLSGLSIRLISVVANPEGFDQGSERVTLLNVTPGTSVNLQGWKVVGPNKSALSFGNVVLETGNAQTFKIPGKGSLQLSNKGGTISVVDISGAIAHSLTYDGAAARQQGAVLVWDGSSNLVGVV